MSNKVRPNYERVGFGDVSKILEEDRDVNITYMIKYDGGVLFSIYGELYLVFMEERINGSQKNLVACLSEAEFRSLTEIAQLKIREEK